ncbi:uncharacterized protein METZ01_LOCUS448422, partial [marine metagenome]
SSRPASLTLSFYTLFYPQRGDLFDQLAATKKNRS